MKDKIIAGLALTIVALGALSACGQPAQEGDSINETVHTYMGKDLHCVENDAGTNYATMSCDFVRYHAENG